MIDNLTMRYWVWLWLVIWMGAGCATETAVPVSTELPPTASVAAATATLTAAALAPSPTPSPMIEPKVTETEVFTPTPTPQLPTPTATSPLPTPTTVPVDRTCPDPAPPAPDYRRYYLSPRTWPTPRPELARDGFWLAQPLPGREPLELNLWYPYGYDVNGRYLIHNGIDATPPQGTPLLAPATGTIVKAGPDSHELYGWRCNWYGELVVLQLDDLWQGQPVYVLFGHVQALQVREGQRVAPGEILAEVGLGGAAVLPHMHLEVRIGRNDFYATRHPLLWLAPPPGQGIIAGRLVDSQGRPWQGVGLSLAGGGLTDPINSWSYLNDPQPVVNPDEAWAENFLFGPIPVGEYVVVTRLQDQDYRAVVTVMAGEVVTVEIVVDLKQE
jgi:murein DD-endopeptidase MepM/ murein hydrolase activator NlpD